MFAIVETGGKQYKVSPGQTVEVEKLPALPGDTVELGQVVLISTDDNQTLIGTPALEDAKIVARVTQVKRGPKLIIFKYKSKARYRRKTGHRQNYTAITIQDIWANGASLLPAKEEAEVPESTEDEAAGVEAAEAASIEVAAAEEEEAEAAPEAPRRRSKKGTTSSEAEAEAASAEGETVTTTTQKTVRTVKRTRVEVVEEDGEVTEVIEGEPEVVSETVEEKKSTRRSRKGE